MGCWGLGGASPEWGWGEYDDELSISAIRQAVDGGVNWFDTAPTYGLGRSEELVGRALKPIRRNVIIASKFGRTWDAAGRLDRCGRASWIVRECEASLRRLDTDYIDLYQMHWPDPATPLEESMKAAADLVASGKVRWVGVCNFDVPSLELAATITPLASHQLLYNALHREAEDTLLPYCTDGKLGVLAYSPLASGLLSGLLTTEYRFGPGDWRATDPDFSGTKLAQSLAIANQLKTIARNEGLSLASLAVAWVLRHEVVSSAIVGLRRLEHLVDTIGAADVVLSQDVLVAIDTVLGGLIQG